MSQTADENNSAKSGETLENNSDVSASASASSVLQPQRSLNQQNQQRMSGLQGRPNPETASREELLALWRSNISDMEYRDRIVNAMTKKKLFPAEYSVYPDEDITRTLADGGLYPDIEDPKFISRLLSKSEFADTISRRETNKNPCEMGPGFEVTPVQRFVANFLHPRTPYMSMLLYHGVGVGKTCAAIQTAEAYLDVYPRRKVLIVVPRNIRSGFYRTIFDMENLTIGRGNTPNSAIGCTGETYLKLTDCLFERDKGLIEKRITRVINQRYAFFGYGQFKNYIRNVVKKIPLGSDEAENNMRITTALKNEFNYRLIIIDEAHNLRDVSSMSMDAAADEDDTEEEIGVNNDDDGDEVVLTANIPNIDVGVHTNEEGDIQSDRETRFDDEQIASKKYKRSPILV